MIGTRQSPVTRTLQYVTLVGYMLFLAFPLVFLLIAAFKTTRETNAPDPSFLPDGLYWDNFKQAIDKTRLFTTAVNSAKVAGVTMVVTTIVALQRANHRIAGTWRG